MKIPVIRTSGSHFEVGRQIGVAARESLQTMHERMRSLYGARWESLLQQSIPFRDATAYHLPDVLSELAGCAEGSGVPFPDLFLMSVEELLNQEVRGDNDAGETWNEAPEWDKGCTDLAAAPPATADGSVWLAHNNDLGRRAQQHLFVTHFCAGDGPEVLAVTVGGIFISIGLNRAGISLTGNQLYANDSRVGVPRLLVVRDILARRTFDSALESALLPERASSYNNLIASDDGRIVSVEGSATDAELIWGEQGATCHANHYLSDRMKPFEQSDHFTSPSAARCSRAAYFAERYNGRIDRQVCERFLRDHVFSPWSVCKHDGDSVTVFSAIINLTHRELWLTAGNPCQSEYELYPW